MPTQARRIILSIAAVASLALPGVALASHGSDDPVSHVSREHHRSNSDRHRGRDSIRRDRRDRDDTPLRARTGSDDGPNH
jgi:Ni/Co efflux regulator RcnB